MNLEFYKDFADALYRIIRAAQGLPPQEDVWNGMIDVKNPIDTSRVNQPQIIGRTYLRILGTMAPEGNENFKIFTDLANYLDEYSKALDGQQWNYAIEIARARNKQELQVSSVNMPPTQPMQKETKKHFWSRGEKQA